VAAAVVVEVAEDLVDIIVFLVEIRERHTERVAAEAV
jgi:hypothetical protein